MKITKLGVFITPEKHFPGVLEVRLDVDLNGRRETVITMIPDDDFVSHFDRFMEDAKRIIKDKLKQP